VIERLTAEIAKVVKERPYRLVVGHGSGSFGHMVAERFSLASGVRTKAQIAGVSLTQERAAMLHRYVIGGLTDAEARSFSIVPSSCIVAAAGQPASFADEPLLLALDRGLIPVLYGDIVMDREQGAAIFSTERLLLMVARSLLERGWTIRRAVWLGETDGLYDAEGRTIPRVSAENFEEAAKAIGDPAGTDVTGGMRHRLESALELARLGIPSFLVNGLTPGLLEKAVRGGPVPGTLVL
jgi:isopentenyl phosphate kinase